MVGVVEGSSSSSSGSSDAALTRSVSPESVRTIISTPISTVTGGVLVSTSSSNGKDFSVAVPSRVLSTDPLVNFRLVREGVGLTLAGDDYAGDAIARGELVPVLTRHRERVEAACEALFPEVVPRAGTVNNAQGWSAGRAAADQARLGPDLEVIDPAQDRAAS